MHRSLRPVVGWLSALGSVAALISMLPVLIQGGGMGFPGELFLFATFVLYLYGAWTGIQALRNTPMWQQRSMWFWAAQVPAFSSSLLSVTTSCGFGAWLYLRFGPGGLGGGWAAYLGSGFRWSYGKPEEVLTVGVNAFAVLLVVLLYVSYVQAARGIEA